MAECRTKEYREKRRQQTTGMPPEVYTQLLIEQAGLCDICEKPMHIPHTDHDHYNPGVYRGLLCGRCNAGLGFIETPGFLSKALQYLRAHRYTAR